MHQQLCQVHLLACIFQTKVAIVYSMTHRIGLWIVVHLALEVTLKQLRKQHQPPFGFQMLSLYTKQKKTVVVG